jgi:high affinity sulfate transporter 1
MKAATQGLGARVKRGVPILSWGPQYQREWLRPDVIAGLTGWSLMVPVAIAYAELAGVPAQYGLYTAFAALALYGIFATSRHVKVTTSSTMAVMSAAVVAPFAGSDPELYLSLTAMLALFVAAYLIGAGILKLGFIADFLSKSVITGFIFGLALNIAIGQIPKILGVPKGSGNFFQQVGQLIANLPQADLATTVLGMSTLVFVMVMKQRNRLFPAGLVAVAVGIVLVGLFGDEVAQLGYEIATVGEIATGLPTIAIPRPGLFSLPYLAVSALGIVFLAVGESLGAARAFAAKYGYAVDANQELLALGAANVGTALVGGFAADASLSNTAAGAEAGNKTQLSSLVTSGLVLLTVLFLAPLFRNLPEAVLGAIITASVIGLMDVIELRRYRATRRPDFWLAMTALFGVLLTDVLTGLLIAVGLSLVLVLYRASRPDVVTLGQVPGETGSYGDVTRHPRYQRIPGLFIFRVDSPLYFFNTNTTFDQILKGLADAEPPPKGVLLDIGATSDLDVASMDALEELVDKLRANGLDVGLAQVRGGVRDRLRKSQLMDKIGREHIFLSVEAGVQAYLKSFPPAGE